ncbi:MAG: OmpP1/FadL family transporter [Luteimonas sp.]
MIQILHRTALALGILGALAVGQAQASGFQLRENSVKNLGRANAGTAVAKDDASVVANNPAAMVNLDRTTVQVDATDIDLTAKFSGSGSTALGTPLSGGNGGDPGSPQLVPALAVVAPFGNFRLGASINAPFGLKTEYDANWVGRYNAVESNVKTVDFTVSGAWAITNQFSLGLSVIHQRTDVTLSNALDFGSALCLGSGNPANCFNPAFPFHPQGADGSVEVKGDDNSFGWIAGAQWRPVENFTIGYSHHSEIDHTLTGNANFAVPASVAGALGPAAPADGPIYAPLTTPSIDTLSVEWDLSPQVRLFGDLQRTGWSSLQQVAIFRQGGAPLGQAEQFRWDDTTYYAIGGEWDLDPAFTLRVGFGHDETPTSDATRDARLPDNTRTLYSIGATWHATPAFSVDAAFQRINIADPSIDVTSPFPGSPSPALGSSLTGKYNAHANLFGLAAQYRF